MLTLSVLVLSFVLVSEIRVEAYLDPGSGSMLVQLLLGGFAGVAVLLKVTWRRLRDSLRSRGPRTGANGYDD